MITVTQQKDAAKKFAERWQGKGDEKQDSQRFWIDLLQNVYGVEDPANFVRFEQRVKLSHTSFIDVMIPATHTMIEQKSRTKELDEPIPQSDGTKLTPAEQAKRYAAALPYSERPRWIVICNFRQFQIFDMERPNDEAQVIELKNLGKEYYRLNFIVDVRDSRITKELTISKEAGEIIGRIYNALLPLYEKAPIEHELALSYLNKLCVRLVFCFYAEDAGLFGRRNLFHDYLVGYRPEHLATELRDLFKVLDTPLAERDIFLEANKAAFPYVNGSLFKEDVPIPPMNEEVCRLIVEDGCNFDWSDMSPVVFGSLFESCLNPETRRKGGMHYTSVENIHKVINPLFLDAYKQKFQQAMEVKSVSKRLELLKQLQKELAKGKYFDPACGSGNFLTESYLSLRRLENDILRETITDKAGTGVLGFAEEEFNPIEVSIQQFYGIEINDFAVSVAKTALWIAESQMFQETEEIIHRQMDFLPLTTNANIHEGNALRMDWTRVTPPEDNVRIMGNPPFSGFKMQTSEQRLDMQNVAGDTIKRIGLLDYVCGWYLKASQYIQNTKIRCAFVSTNSISQGEQVEILWTELFKRHIHIDFAYQTFIWTSESSHTAKVHCIIIGFSINGTCSNCWFYKDNIATPVKNISPYIFPGESILVKARKKPLSDVPQMIAGNKTVKCLALILSEKEKADLIAKEPKASKYIKRMIGAREFINNIPRYCLWLVDATPKEIKSMPEVYQRVLQVRRDRLASKDKQAHALANKPTTFRDTNNPDSAIVVPLVSSQNRRYIPMGYIDKSVIANNKVSIIPDGTLYQFGILSSNVHNTWMRRVAMRMKSDYSYSLSMVYNTFPWPAPTPAQKAKIEQTAQGILDARAKYPDSSLADLYDEVTMPPELRKAHRANDKAVMQAYGFWGKLNTESECVAELMKMYEHLTKK